MDLFFLTQLFGNFISLKLFFDFENGGDFWADSGGENSVLGSLPFFLLSRKLEIVFISGFLLDGTPRQGWVNFE